MQKSEPDLYNEAKKLLEPHKTALEALTRKKDVAVVEVATSRTAFAALVADTFNAITEWEKKGSLKRLRASYDACLSEMEKWAAQKEASLAFEAIKNDIGSVQTRIAAAEKKQEWPAVLNLVAEFRETLARHFPAGGAWAKIGEQKRYHDGFKGCAETLEKRCASGVEFQAREAARLEQEAKKRDAQGILSEWRVLERRLRELNVPDKRETEAAAIAALLDECSAFVAKNAEQLGKEIGNANNFMAYQREASAKIPVPEPEGPRVSSWPDLTGSAGGSDFVFFCSSNSLYRVDHGGHYSMVGNYAAWTEVAGLTVISSTGRVFLISRASLYSLDSKSGQYEQIGKYGAYANAKAICHAGDSIFIACDRSIYEVNPKDGHAESFAGYGSWDGVTALASAASLLFVFCQNKLFRIDSNSGACDQLPGSWPDIKGVAGFRDHVFAISGGALYKVNAHSGSYERVAGGWGDGAGLAATAHKLFGVSQTFLYDIDPESGAEVRI